MIYKNNLILMIFWANQEFKLSVRPKTVKLKLSIHTYIFFTTEPVQTDLVR